MMAPLNNEAFAVALRAGLGRASLHVQQFGLTGVADLVLAACLQDQAYDPQCEGSRAAWLFRMFKDTQEYPAFSSAIAKTLEHEPNTWNAQQLCELAALMGKNGDARAHGALRLRALRQAEFAESADWVGADALLSLEGLQAVPDLARCYGRVLGRDPESNPPYFNDFSVSPDLLTQSDALLQELAPSDAEIRNYWNYWQREKVERARCENEPRKTLEEARAASRERIRRELPLEKILQEASAGIGEFPGRYARFGDGATPEELAVIL